MSFGGVSQGANTSPTESPFKISENTRRVLGKVRHMEPLYFKMFSPVSQPQDPASPPKASAELFIDSIMHLCLVISLIFGQEECPKSKYKAQQNVIIQPDGKMKKGNKRTMLIQLAKDFSLSLRRDDQTLAYQVKWISEEMKGLWSAVRSEFLALCRAHPEMIESIQLCMIQELVSDDALRAQIEAHCRSINAWMMRKSGPYRNQDEKDRLLCWREASLFAMAVASQKELDDEDSAPEVVTEGAARGGTSSRWADLMEDDDFDLEQRWQHIGDSWAKYQSIKVAKQQSNNDGVKKQHDETTSSSQLAEWTLQ